MKAYTITGKTVSDFILERVESVKELPGGKVLVVADVDPAKVVVRFGRKRVKFGNGRTAKRIFASESVDHIYWVWRSHVYS